MARARAARALTGESCISMRYKGENLTMPAARELLESALKRPPSRGELDALLTLVKGDDSAITDGMALALLVHNAMLFTAIKNGDLEGVLAAFSAGAQINARDADNGTPVMLACDGGEAAVLGYLLNKRPDLTLQDNRGWTALHNAVCSENVELVRLLLPAGPPLTVESNAGDTPLALAGNRGVPPIPVLLYDHCLAQGHSLTAEEVRQLHRHLIKDPRFTPAVRSLLESCFVQAVGGGLPVFAPDDIAGQLQAHLAGLYDTMTSAVAEQLEKAALSDGERAMIRFALADLQRLKSAAQAERTENLEDALRLIGHLAHASDRVLADKVPVSLGGWTPTKALWHQSLMAAHLLESESLSTEERQYLSEELAATAAALARAEELSLVQELFVGLGTTETTAAHLAACYTEQAAVAASIFPCGSRLHATYLTATPQDDGKRIELAMHNLGRLTDKYHVSTAPHLYLPFVVTGIGISSLPAILTTMITSYVTPDSVDTGTALSALYDTIKAGGTVLGDKELRARYQPMLQQVANNCSIANMQSAGTERGLRLLADAFAGFARRIRALELDRAVSLWSQAYGKVLLEPSIPVVRALGELRRAIYLGDLAACENLLKGQPACIKVADEDGRTLLHTAAIARSPQLARLMLQNGADAAAADRDGRLAIEYALDQPDLLGELIGLLQEKSVMPYVIIRHVVPFYRQANMNPDIPGNLIAEIEAETKFRVLLTVNETTLKILLPDATGTPFVGYIKTDYVK
jgi:ankyrin repeat protein